MNSNERIQETQQKMGRRHQQLRSVKFLIENLAFNGNVLCMTEVGMVPFFQVL